MVKRCRNVLDDDEPPAKRHSLGLGSREILTDVTGNKWRIGRAVGVGAFGEIFLASDRIEEEVDEEAEYVVKIESHTNGPLFVEINCYLRIGKLNIIEEWKREHRLKRLGMPHYIASGSHYIRGTKYRFLILPRYTTDLENVLKKTEQKIHLKSVLTVSLQLLDILQYIHEKGFIHADIKASNVLLNLRKETQMSVEDKHYLRYSGVIKKIRRCRLAKIPVVDRNLRANKRLRTWDEFLGSDNNNDRREVNLNKIYLLDYGLASKYKLSNGEHKCPDMRRAHAGTISFCSLDAHRGALSRRSDLESLGYNIIYWLTGDLPWMKNKDDPEVVRRKKQQCMSNLEPFLHLCFGNAPKFLLDYFKYLNKLDFTDEPDYNFCRKLFKDALYDYRMELDGNFNFKKSEPWQKKTGEYKNKNIETVIRTPLRSNLPSKKVLRKNKKIKDLNWSKILMDPEEILKQAKTKEKKLSEFSNDGSQSLSNLDIGKLGPTEAMLEVYNNYLERINNSDGSSPKYKMEFKNNCFQGYTSAMIQVHNRMMEQREIEKAVKIASCRKKRGGNKVKSKTNEVPIISGVTTRSQKLLSSMYSLRNGCS